MSANFERAMHCNGRLHRCSYKKKVDHFKKKLNLDLGYQGIEKFVGGEGWFSRGEQIGASGLCKTCISAPRICEEVELTILFSLVCPLT